MKNLKWHSGQPPHVGWWNASEERNPAIWRWWNGKYWSLCIDAGSPDSVAANFARRRAYFLGTIEWTYAWPKGARVPRINPKTGEVTGRP